MSDFETRTGLPVDPVNAGYVQAVYQQYERDPASVPEAWRTLFGDGHRPAVAGAVLASTAGDRDVPPARAGDRDAASSAPAGPASGEAAPRGPAAGVSAPPHGATPLRGPAARLAANMQESLGVPTATSYREVDVERLVQVRAELNRALAPVRISYTHLVAHALVRAALRHPEVTHAFAEVGGAPYRVDPGGVNLGLAVDIERADGARLLVVPVVRDAGTLDFAAFLQSYDALVAGARGGRLGPDEYTGATITLTNPGTLGTSASVPRLLPGQGSIVATGAIRPIGMQRLMTVSCTYDHRIIQGAESGRFLATIDAFLQGADGFYESIAASLGVTLEGSGTGPAAPGTAPALSAEGTATAPATPAAAPAPAPAATPGLAATAAAGAPVSAGPAASAGAPLSGGPLPGMREVAAAMALVRTYRNVGHLAARLDPLGSEPPGDPALDPVPLGLTPEVMARIPTDVLGIYVPGATLADALPELERAYCGTIAYEVEHIGSHEERGWLRRTIESGAHLRQPGAEARRQVLAQLTWAEALEQFLQRAYLGQKRFSIEGLDVLVPMLNLAVELAGEQGIDEVVLGMAHRGRLNVLAHVVGVPYQAILAEFERVRHGAGLGPEEGTGDVKYHQGAGGVRQTAAGRSVVVTLSPNPSHLEVVNPVIEGRARAAQTDLHQPSAPRDLSGALPILVHGDASFAAQGVVAETFNLARLPGYTTGGTLHLIANNQLGFTVEPWEGRSTQYSSDLAKGFDVPIVHVNADDPDACLAAVRLAFAYREHFHADVVIDVVGYRRRGHNEGDEPAYTQPSMYRRIAEHPTVRALYLGRLADAGIADAAQADAEERAAQQQLAALRDSLAPAPEEDLEAGPADEVDSPAPDGGERSVPLERPITAVPAERLRTFNEQLLTWPAEFHVHPKLERQLLRRRDALGSEPRIEWAQAEALAFAALLTSGVPIRLTGQDTERGTFSQRHMVLHDAETGARYAPIQHLPGARASFELHNSPLSELACLGFEYGYAVGAPDALVLWEAQYGDFENGAEVVIDQFVVAGLTKWGQTSRLTLLLPHGYEGQGPEHSSARLERFLALGAERNIRVANCTTPAQYFHLLRWQALISERRPLVLLTPKSLLRLPGAASSLDELASGGFQAILDDPSVEDRGAVRRLVLCSGKVYYDLALAPDRADARDVAIARLELLYPFAARQLTAFFEQYPELEEVVWAQEEPRNLGARKFLMPELRRILPDRIALSEVSRPERAAPAEGHSAAHRAEQLRIVRAALERQKRSPRRPRR